jgi:hypothetical protein
LPRAVRGNALHFAAATLIARWLFIWGRDADAMRPGAVMANQREIDRRNDAKFLAPLLSMALVFAGGILFFAFTGHTLASM